MPLNKHLIYLDPSYNAFNGDKIFDMLDSHLNRDDQLLPFSRLRESAKSKYCLVRTADYIGENKLKLPSYYYSLGLTPDFLKLAEKKVRPRGILLMEPPVVAPEMYNALPELSTNFDVIYLHNIHGDGYSLNNINHNLLHKFYWPIPYHGVLTDFWENTKRLKKIVVVNSHHKPLNPNRELYSKRIEAIAELSKYEAVDLFGRGWNKLLTRCSLWLPYILNRSALMKVFKGASDSKYQTLSNYCFSLCFENMVMDGYLTEKIFDCFYTGTIPIYLGAPDILDYIPESAFIDCRKFDSWKQMLDYVLSMKDKEITDMRNAGKKFMESNEVLKYYNSLENIMLADL
jgi:hypothetical protein